MASVERTLTINIRKEILKVPKYKRAKKAITAVREFLQQHMKATQENVKLGKHLNLKLWEHGIKNPVTRVTVLAKKDDKGIVTAELPNIPVKKQRPQKAKPAAKADNKAAKAEKTATAATATAAAKPATPVVQASATATVSK